MKRLVAVFVLAAQVSCAGSDGSNRAETLPPIRSKVMDVIAVRAVVSAIDRTQRRVTIVDDAGNEAIFYADEAVTNFAQIRVGDEVVGELIGALAIEVRPPTAAEAAAGVSMRQFAGRAEPGQRPAGAFVRRITGVFTIDALDRQAGLATLRGPTGVPHVIPVRDPARFDRVQVGDTVVATYTESVRLTVRAPRAPATVPVSP